MTRVWRAARYMPEGAGIELRYPQVLVVAGNERHADGFLEWHDILIGTWVLDELAPSDPMVDLLQHRRSGVYLTGINTEGDLALHYYEMDTSRLRPVVI